MLRGLEPALLRLRRDLDDLAGRASARGGSGQYRPVRNVDRAVLAGQEAIGKEHLALSQGRAVAVLRDADDVARGVRLSERSDLELGDVEAAVSAEAATGDVGQARLPYGGLLARY